MNQLLADKKVSIGIFVAIILLSLLGLAFYSSNKTSPSAPKATPTNIPPLSTPLPTNKPLRMETFYFTPTP